MGIIFITLYNAKQKSDQIYGNPVYIQYHVHSIDYISMSKPLPDYTAMKLHVVDNDVQIGI